MKSFRPKNKIQLLLTAPKNLQKKEFRKWSTTVECFWKTTMTHFWLKKKKSPARPAFLETEKCQYGITFLLLEDNLCVQTRNAHTLYVLLRFLSSLKERRVDVLYLLAEKAVILFERLA